MEGQIVLWFIALTCQLCYLVRVISPQSLVSLQWDFHTGFKVHEVLLSAWHLGPGLTYLSGRWWGIVAHILSSN